ncbi:MAG: YeiH family protein [Proteobacteria bacterium]|nr:YeiH family protein [Pseudomonadota bacterium]
MGTESDVVSNTGKSTISDLWKLEDYWAIWLGFALLIIGLIIFLPKADQDIRAKIDAANAILTTESQKAPFKTIEWYNAVAAKEKLKATDTAIAKKIKSIASAPQGWKTNPLQAFFMDSSTAENLKIKATEKYELLHQKETEALAGAAVAQTAAALAGYANKDLNEAAVSAIDTWRSAHAAASKAKKKTSVKQYNIIGSLIILMVFLAVFFGIGKAVMGESFIKFLLGFAFVFVIAVLAYAAENNATMKHYGIGYAAWAIIFGLLISNTVGTPKWVMPGVQTEYYIKTGLVLLGAEILFGKILSIGIPGIFVAWVVTPIVLVTTYWFGQNIIKMPSKTLNITISADMSVCGVSAAIATAAACRAKKEELTLAVGLSLVFTSIMMVVMPIVIKALGMPHVLGGAWMGGTIDATGAVAAAGAFLSERALYVAATIKMIQNVLIGVIAFFVALYWVAKVDRAEGKTVGAIEIWHRFPKFVIGFIVASIVFSMIYQSIGKDVGYVVVEHGALRGFSRLAREWFFCLAFASIGLATNFRELKSYFKGGKPLILYVCGQSLNLILTLVMAYVMFYIVFPDITAGI